MFSTPTIFTRRDESLLISQGRRMFSISEEQRTTSLVASSKITIKSMSSKAQTEVEDDYLRKYYTALDTIIVCIKIDSFEPTLLCT